MSKNIIIQEGGQGKQLTVDKLKTNLVGGGTCLWVPEGEVQLTTKTITENGTYKASDEGYYGYSEVSVSGIGKVVGKDQNGKEHIISTDSSGNLVDTGVPSEIRIVTPPSFTGPYGDGANISFDGLTVEALYGDGTSAGMIPYSELLFPVTVTEYDPTSGAVETTHECEDFGQGPWPQPVNSTGGFVSANVYNSNVVVMFEYSHIAILTDADGNRYDTLFCSSTPGTARIGTHNFYTEDTWEDISVAVPYDYDGKTVYYNGTGYGGFQIPSVPGRNNAVLGNDLEKGKAAWTIIYGTVTGMSGGMQVPVQWARPGDGKILETSFGITVVDVTPNEQGQE